MIKLWVIYDGNKIVAWSTKQMSEDEVPIEITKEQYEKLMSGEQI